MTAAINRSTGLAESFALLESSIARLRKQLAGGENFSEEDLFGALTGLSAMPLSTDEYCRALANLKAAARYAANSELGAARYTLDALTRRLRRVLV